MEDYLLPNCLVVLIYGVGYGKLSPCPSMWQAMGIYIWAIILFFVILTINLSYLLQIVAYWLSGIVTM